MPGAQLLKPTEHLLFPSLAFPCEAQLGMMLRSGSKISLEPSQRPTTVPFCAVAPCRAYLGEGKDLLGMLWCRQEKLHF